MTRAIKTKSDCAVRHIGDVYSIERERARCWWSFQLFLPLLPPAHDNNTNATQFGCEIVQPNFDVTSYLYTTLNCVQQDVRKLAKLPGWKFYCVIESAGGVCLCVCVRWMASFGQIIFHSIHIQMKTTESLCSWQRLGIFNWRSNRMNAHVNRLHVPLRYFV